ncbi:MAG: class I SAM-dependent methyltransferase [Christensenellaceae bacterium]|jgi:ubiquinone/menaquinone biosynthesis C-methylase UbiE|nr:class I SAM-dependent methyltransferase [Christensenellaceae bacterium]
MTEFEQNAKRFSEIASVYDEARPAMPEALPRIVRNYLGGKPGRVLDLGCGTGLSTAVWRGLCAQAIGIEPNEEMLRLAREKEAEGLFFLHAFSHEIPLPGASVDAIICSQSFHWMQIPETLREAGRLLRDGGLFAAVDYDWPPVCAPRVERAYQAMIDRVKALQSADLELRDPFTRADKSAHLEALQKSRVFSYVRELYFMNEEGCSRERLLGMAKSQGGLSRILSLRPEMVKKELSELDRAVEESYGGADFRVSFCYRLRLGLK